MTGLFYKCLMRLTRRLGPWVFMVASRTIAAGYFLFFPGRVRVGMHFYRAVFPNRPWIFYAGCTWKQYQNFIWVYFDRFFSKDFSRISYVSEGFEYLETLGEKTGGIILMSHLGNWELATHLLARRLRQKGLLLYMGVRDKEAIEQIQKQDLIRAGVKIVAVSRQETSAFDIMEGVRFLRSGGLVSMAGDILWRKDQRSVRVRFLNQDARLPEAPHLFAMLTGVPLFIFLSFRTGKGRYCFTLSKPLYIEAVSREGRGEAIRRSAQQYAEILEEAVRAHPFEWFHFDRFLEGYD